MSFEILFAWLIVGAAATVFADWACQLDFRRERVSVGTILLWFIGVVLPPISIFVGLIFLACWLFMVDGQGSLLDRTWPDWWGRARYRQHRFGRWLWYLGHPPEEEDWLSGWRDVPERWRC